LRQRWRADWCAEAEALLECRASDTRAAGLPDWLTLDACRRAGLNEIADSDMTETQEMAMSGHTTPNAKRRYVKRSEAQRLIAARKRRVWVAEQEQARGGTRDAQSPQGYADKA
jgi:hypothetical protein